MKRILSAVLLALALALTGACSDSQSGGASNPDNQLDQAPASDAEEPAELEVDPESESD